MIGMDERTMHEWKPNHKAYVHINIVGKSKKKKRVK